MVSRKLAFLANNILSRAKQDDVFCPTELRQLAAAMLAELPTIEAMEARPVPPAFRLIHGGAA